LIGAKKDVIVVSRLVQVRSLLVGILGVTSFSATRRAVIAHLVILAQLDEMD
jgi:hypothetical protein